MSISFVQINDLLIRIASGLIAALVFGPFAIWLARRMRLVDMPGLAAHKLHHSPIPLAGGINLALSLILLVPLLHLWHKPILSLLIAAAIIFLFGLLDDAKGLSAPEKFTGQITASIFLIASGLSIHFFRNFSGTYLNMNISTALDWGITIFWVVGISNSFNLVDSMDGLSIGIAEIAFAFFMGMAVVTQHSLLASFCAVCLGICIGLFYFNKTPAFLFLGDSGAQTLGVIIAAVAIICSPNTPSTSCWFAPIMVLGVPIFDTTLVVVSRIRRRKPVFKAECNHTFHRLVALGIDPNRAVATIHLVSLALSFLAFLALFMTQWLVYIVFGLVACTGIVALVYLERTQPQW